MILAFVGIIASQQEGYRTPPSSILSAALTPWYENIAVASISPDGTRFLSLEKDGMPSIATLAKPYLNLGGLQIDLKASRERSLTTQSLKNLRITEIASGRTISLKLPAGVRVSNPTWSPDGKRLAFLAHFEASTLLFVADSQTGDCRAITSRPVLPTLFSDISWDGSGRYVATVFRPKEFSVPSAGSKGPLVQTSEEKARKLSTFPSLLETNEEKELYLHFGTGQLSRIEIGSGKVEDFGKPNLFESVSLSPDGNFIRTTVVDQAATSAVPVDSFATRDVLVAAHGGETVLERHSQDYSSEEPASKPDAWRGFQWFPGGVLYLQSAEKGKQDRVMYWRAPFVTGQEKVLFNQKEPIEELRTTRDGKLLFLSTTADGSKVFEVVDLAGGSKKFEAKGRTLMTDEADHVVISSDGKHAFLSGTVLGKDPLTEAPRPFVDLVDLGTGESQRVFESKAAEFEQPSLLNGSSQKFLVTRQSPTKVAQVFVMDEAAKTERQLTSNQPFATDISEARRETIQVTRADGFKFLVNVTMPEFTYRNPAFFWIYPAEFENQAQYDKSKASYNRNLFHTFAVHNKQILIREGYVVVEPDLPIVGPAGRMNDEFDAQLRNSLSAVIDELAKRDWIDRDRLGVGGHSYGAFAAASAMAHTPFFKCGIAGDGCYNRSLTPFGFQSEERTLWQARETYQDMSPFLFSEQVTGALLLYHGAEDQNPGTSPINSQRMFGALQSLGKASKLLLYPYEDHLQIARETILDQWARFVEWLDRYLKVKRP